MEDAIDTVTVCPATVDDVAAITDLVEDLDRHYGTTDFPPAARRRAEVRRVLFDESPAPTLLLAKTGGSISGMASYAFHWPAIGVSRSLFLKELYVYRAQRRRGIGTLLLRRIFEIAEERNCTRVEWMTDEQNTGAQLFYSRLGFESFAGKILYRLDTGTTGRRARHPVVPADG